MEPQTWTEEHSAAIGHAAPAIPAADVDELDRVWARVSAGISGSAAPRRRPARVVLAAGLTAAALTVGGVAAAEVFSAHTGRYATDAEDIRLGGPGERLDPAAPDYENVIAQLTSEIPFPSQRAREISRQELVADGEGDTPRTSAVSTAAMRGWTAQYAVCAWANQWAAATNSGDEASRATAVRMLEEAPGWPAVTDLDSEQQIRYKRIAVTDGSGRTTTRRVVDNTVFGYLPLVRQAAPGRDVEAMGRLLIRWTYCPTALMADFPQAMPKIAKR